MKGFTLIELMLVIVIISILSAIAIPQYVAYKQRGVNQHMTNDLENARIAMETYFADKYTYTDSLSDLLAVGLRQTAGVTLTVTLNPPSSYTLTASKSGGTQASFTYDSTIGVIQ